MRRFYTWTLGATFACALILGGGAHGAFAASKAAASKTSPSPAPTPTETPEPANIAIPRLEAELKKNPNDKTVLVKLASYYLASDHADKALPLTQKLISLGEKTAQVYYIEGIANEQLGKVPEATSALEQASNLDPTNAQVLLALTDLYIRTNKEADAERVAKRAVTFNGKDAHVLINYALVLAHEKKYDEARSQ
ncbi:MAG: tetratricopeptide repeat protein, partial [Vulcanimicrobiaceae bacterium]